jgi:glycosyltransferase involved in cell wall biosynthesis
MRILIIHQPGNAGVARHVLDLVTGLNQSEIDVSVIYSESQIGSYYRKRMESLRTSGVIFKNIPMRREVGFNDLLCFIKIVIYIFRNGPFDIIHSHSSKAGALTRLLPFKFKQVYSPHAYITMNDSLGKLSLYFYKCLEKILSLRCHTIVTSRKELSEALNLGICQKRVKLLYHGSECASSIEEKISNRNFYRKKWRISENQIVLGSIARYDLQKDHAFAVKFINHLDQFSSSIYKLVLVGDGPEKKKITDLVSKYGIEDRILFEAPADYTKIMPAFDFYFMHSKYEGFPYVLLDAMFYGLPILSRNVGGSEIVNDGVNGIFLDQLTPEESSVKFIEKSISPQKIRHLSNASVKTSICFEINKMIENYISFYNVIKYK